MYVMIHRPDPDMCITYSKNLREWGKSKILMKPRQKHWDCLKIGAAGPPIEIDEGWLQIYHGVDNQHIYRLGAIILEKDNPEKIIYRADKPFLEPYEEYECKGQVPNVVFSCGAIKNRDNILISYGCADSVIGVSSFKINEILI
jgi:beta-1,2-mannobiose phosphorylase / 1,2-beta-oligomannan phosphorylase